MAPKTFLEFAGPRTSTDSFPRLQLIKVNFLLYLLLLGWLYCDLRENSFFAKISRLVDSGMLPVTSHTDDVPRNERNPSEPRGGVGKSSDDANKPILKVRTFVFLCNTHTHNDNQPNF